MTEGKNQKTFKICIYNHMYGGNGQSFQDAFNAHYHLRFGKDVEKIITKTKLNIKETIEMIDESNADIFGLCEVLGDNQAQSFETHFKELGYKSIHRDVTHEKKSGLKSQVVLATRLKSELKNDTQKFPRGKNPGQGGGIIHVYIPKIDTHIIHCHLICPFQVLRIVRNQLQVVALEKMVDNIIKNSKTSKIIVMGDFNVPHQILKTLHPKICSLNNLFDPKIPTYVHPVNKNIKFIIDGILGYNIEPHKSGVKNGKSDHRLVWAKVRMGEFKGE